MNTAAGNLAVDPQKQADRRRLAWCALAALALEVVVLTAVAWSNHWLSHPQKTTGLDESRFIETQMFEVPKAEDAHLRSEKPATVPEVAVSRVANQGRRALPHEGIQSENQTKPATSPTATAPTHGPMPVYNPAPVIPGYLQNKDLNTSVVIEFLITAQGAVTPRLLASSGNEELDAIALSTVKQWQFRPAEQDHKPIDAKVRLRIVFEIH